MVVILVTLVALLSVVVGVHVAEVAAMFDVLTVHRLLRISPSTRAEGSMVSINVSFFQCHVHEKVT